MSNIGVLMVTGVYQPEVNGAANQCRYLVSALRNKVSFMVLTTTRDPYLPQRSIVDGVDVFRVLSNKNLDTYCGSIVKVLSFLLFRRKDFQIVHLHGFSLKSSLVVLISKIFHKKVITKMTSIGHDDPIAIKQRGFLIKNFFSKAHVFVGTNPEFEKLYQQSELTSSRYQQIPNGVDTNRFCPVTDVEKIKLRNELGLPGKMKLILFVGHFSRGKCPDLLLTAWKRYVAETFPDTGIVFVGSTNPDHYEVDAELVKEIQQLAKTYIDERIFFVERTLEIEKYYQSADIFVLPSKREGLPNALLEAMACGLPAVASNLKVVTDWIIEDGKNGFLFELEDRNRLGEILLNVLQDDPISQKMGLKARKIVMKRFSMDEVAKKYVHLYSKLSR